MKERIILAALIPLLAAIIIATYAGGLGVIFMVLDSAMEEWGVIALGLALVVGVPSVAALLQRRVERE